MLNIINYCIIIYFFWFFRFNLLIIVSVFINEVNNVILRIFGIKKEWYLQIFILFFRKFWNIVYIFNCGFNVAKFLVAILREIKELHETYIQVYWLQNRRHYLYKDFFLLRYWFWIKNKINNQLCWFQLLQLKSSFDLRYKIEVKG